MSVKTVFTMNSTNVDSAVILDADRLWALWNELNPVNMAGPRSCAIMYDNPVLNASEEAVGMGLTGTDAEVVMTGDVPGAVGYPTSRKFGVGMKAKRNNALYNKVLMRDDHLSGTYIMKLKDLSYNGSLGLINVQGVVQTLSSGRMRIGGQFTSYLPTSGDVYIAIFTDGVTVYGGWTTTKPTKLSDFGTNYKTMAMGTIASFPVEMSFISGTSGTLDMYYEVYSPDCLIDLTS